MESMFSAGLRKYVSSFQKVIHNLVVSVMVVFIVSIFKGLFFIFGHVCMQIVLINFTIQ